MRGGIRVGLAGALAVVATVAVVGISSAEERAPYVPPSAATGALVDGTPCTGSARACVDISNGRAWLLDNGKIRYAGVSNFNPEEIVLANEILGGRLTAVQNQFSPSFRSSEPELELCDKLGIAFLPWSPFGGISKAGALSGPFKEVGDVHGVSPHQVCLAWMLAKSEVVVPIPGASRPASISDSAAATHLELTRDELTRLDG